MTRFSSPLTLSAIMAPLFLVSACGPKAPVGAPPPPVPYAEAVLYDTQGERAGKVTFMAENGMLNGTIDVVPNGLPAGAHGMHIHAIGKCILPDFSSAGGHLNPDSKQHGMENPAGPHQGDLPMLVVNERGDASMTFVAHTSFDQLFDRDGSSFVVHSGPDDMKTDPSGNSGSRMLCGVLYRKFR